MGKSVKSFLIATLVLTLLFSLCACGKNKNNVKNNASAEDMAGLYVLSKLTYADGTVVSGKDLETEMNEFWDMEVSDTYVELRADGTGTMCVYNLCMEIGWTNEYFWYSDFLDPGLYFDEYMEFDEDGLPIENPTVETTEPTIPEAARIPFTFSGKTITLDPEGLGEIMEFTKQ